MNSIEKCQLTHKKKIQAEIRIYMCKKNLQPAGLAKLLGKPRSAIRSWLNSSNGHNFSIETCIELQLKLGIQILNIDFTDNITETKAQKNDIKKAVINTIGKVDVENNVIKKSSSWINDSLVTYDLSKRFGRNINDFTNRENFTKLNCL